MDPTTRIVTTIGGEYERKPTATRGWYINHRYRPWKLVGEVSRELDEITEIWNINLGTSPYMQMWHQGNAEPLKWTLARLIRKCPHQQHWRESTWQGTQSTIPT